MYAKDTNSVGNMIHTEEKTIHRSNTLTRNRDSNKTLVGDSKRKRMREQDTTSSWGKTKLTRREQDTTLIRETEIRLETSLGSEGLTLGKRIFQRKNIHWRDTS